MAAGSVAASSFLASIAPGSVVGAFEPDVRTGVVRLDRGAAAASDVELGRETAATDAFELDAGIGPGAVEVEAITLEADVFELDT